MAPGASKMKETCETCKYYKNRCCRFNAPIGMVDKFGYDEPRIMTMWPEVFCDDWCGQYTREYQEKELIT